MGLNNFGVPLNGATDTTVMPKLQYRFRVTFSGFGSNTGGISEATLTRNVITATRPALSHDEITLDVYNSRIYMAGKHTLDPVTIVLRDDVNSETIRNVNQQVQKQIELNDQVTAGAAADYKFTTTIDMLNGSHGGDASIVIDSYELYGCYLQNVQYGDLSYAASEQVQATLTIRYDNFDHFSSGQTTFEGTGENTEVATNGPA